MQNTVQKVVKRRGRNESTIRRTKSISGKIGNIDQFYGKKNHAHRRQLVLVFSIIIFFTLVKI